MAQQSPLDLVSGVNNDMTSTMLHEDEYSHVIKLSPNKQKQSRDHIHMCYFICLLLTITIGTIQFGWSIGCWNSGWLFYAKSVGLYESIDDFTLKPVYYNQEEAVNRQLIVQAVTTGGSMFGALIAGPISRIGRWKSILLCNMLVIIGNGLQFNWTNYYMFLAGRAVFGVAAGGFSCICPKYINEVSPKEVSGPAGAMFQVMVAFGIFMSLIVTFPFDPATDPEWRIDLCLYILFGIPIALALFQTFLMVSIFTFDTPKVLSQKGETNELRKFLLKIYEAQAVQDVIDDLVYDDDGEKGGSGYGQICCNPQYKRATGLGIALSIFQQLTGINMLMLYSGTILKGLNLPVNTVNALMGGVSLGCTFVGLTLLNFFGRRTIMLVGNLVMSLALITFGVNQLLGDKAIQNVAVASMFTFLAFFQFSSGPIVWLYMAETMQDKAQSIATVFNWLVILIIAVATPLLDEWLGPENFSWVFIFFGAATAVGFLFILCFMKETKDLSPIEIEALFNGQNANRLKSQDMMKFDQNDIAF